MVFFFRERVPPHLARDFFSRPVDPPTQLPICGSVLSLISPPVTVFARALQYFMSLKQLLLQDFGSFARRPNGDASTQLRTTDTVAWVVDQLQSVSPLTATCCMRRSSCSVWLLLVIAASLLCVCDGFAPYFETSKLAAKRTSDVPRVPILDAFQDDALAAVVHAVPLQGEIMCVPGCLAPPRALSFRRLVPLTRVPSLAVFLSPSLFTFTDSGAWFTWAVNFYRQLEAVGYQHHVALATPEACAKMQQTLPWAACVAFTLPGEHWKSSGIDYGWGAYGGARLHGKGMHVLLRTRGGGGFNTPASTCRVCRPTDAPPFVRQSGATCWAPASRARG